MNKFYYRERAKWLPEHDRELIEKAIETSAFDWGSIRPEQAITSEGRKLLKDISTYLYHREEALNGLL